MQVERKPSRWPYVGMLSGLLVACFLAPSYWQLREADDARPDGREVQSRRRVAVASRVATIPRQSSAVAPNVISSGQTLDWIAATGLVPNVGSWPQAAEPPGLSTFRNPTVDDLLESLRSDTDLAPLSIACQDFRSWRPRQPGAPTSPNPDETPEIPGEHLTAVLRWAGAAAAEYSPAMMGGWLGTAASRCWDRGAMQPGETPAALGPRDANLPLSGPHAPVERRNSPRADAAEIPPAAAAMSPSPWSVPDALFLQLARLSRDPYSAYWANETVSQLRALMQADRFQGEHTMAILAALSHSAETADQLAEQAGDDRMRVELLRAHWALARRLDCWKLMNDIRVASVQRARFAARGSLDSLMHDVPKRDDVESLALQIEAYERTRDPALAIRVAQAGRVLATSPDGLDRALGEAVEKHYRNANVRIAITETMLNRFVPTQQCEAQPVFDQIVGTPVRGQSETLTQNRVRLEPAAGRWQMNLESSGAVDSNTLADGGSARLRSFGSTDFTARKTVIFENGAVQMQPSVASANNYNQLAGVTTDFDWVPLFGAFARGQAVDRYRSKRLQAKSEIEWKVTSQVSERLDQEAGEAVDRVQREIRERVTDPLAQSGVDLTTVELTTTDERLIARLRVAGNAQLGGHTPRPRALSDSLASMQIHETALTNAAVSLGLDGARLTAPQLQTKLREKFPGLASSERNEARPDTVFQFANQGAVQFRIGGGRFEIAILVAEFEQDRQHIRNFIVHAYYLPVVNGMSAELVRDGALGIEGRISATERARLYSVFNEVLGADRRLPVMRLNDSSEPGLSGLMITQLVLEDGWLGLAIGPGANGRVAERSRSLR